jgi:uncharacterized protein (UPF0264 family)
VIWRGLLVSVRDGDEAAEALAGGSAIIDVKEPLAGPLGAAAPGAVAAIAAVVGSSAPWTLACGELLGADADVEAGRQRALEFVAAVCGGLMAAPAPAAVKVGLSGAGPTPWRDALEGMATGLPAGTGLVAVAYADWQRCRGPDPEALVAAAASAGCLGVLVDTFDKSGPGLFGLVDRAAIRRWVALAHAAGMPIALAGKLSLDDVASAVSVGADVVGVRSVACGARQPGGGDGDRLGAVQRDRVGRAVERFATTLAGVGGRVPG